MKLSPLILFFPVFLASCSMPDKVVDARTLTTGRPNVISRSNDVEGFFSTVATVEKLARKHPGRSAFEAALSQKVVTGELAVNELSVTYEDDTTRCFK